METEVSTSIPSLQAESKSAETDCPPSGNDSSPFLSRATRGISKPFFGRIADELNKTERLQCNLHHSGAATATLLRRLDTEHDVLAEFQELSILNSRKAGFTELSGRIFISANQV